jgi:hypothetical protein
MPIQTAADSISNSAGSPYGFKNRIINGAITIDQRLNGSGNTLVTATETFVVDRFVAYKDGGVITSGQSTIAPAGFTNSISWSVGTGYSATSGQYTFLKYHIEGYNVGDLGFGTSDAKTVTLSFWVRASVTGTYSGTLGNVSLNRSYPWTYTINSANTWEYKTITVPGDTTGTWAKDNTTGLRIYWDLGTGSGSRGTAGSWQATTLVGATGTTSISATTGATFYITGIQLEKGSQATAFDYRPYSTELQLCKRYYRIAKWRWQGQSAGLGQGQGWTWVFDPEMRTTPSITTSNFTNGSSFNLAGPQGGDTMGMYAQGDGNGTVILYTAANAEF